MSFSDTFAKIVRSVGSGISYGASALRDEFKRGEYTISVDPSNGTTTLRISTPSIGDLEFVLEKTPVDPQAQDSVNQRTHYTLRNLTWDTPTENRRVVEYHRP